MQRKANRNVQERLLNLTTNLQTSTTGLTNAIGNLAHGMQGVSVYVPCASLALAGCVFGVTVGSLLARARLMQRKTRRTRASSVRMSAPP